MARPSRSDETRAMKARPMLGARDGELNLDVSGLPKGVTAKWIRETYTGKYDSHNIQRAMQAGYQPVRAAELSGYTHFRLPGAPSDGRPDDELVRQGGMVLMVRDSDLDRQEKAALYEETLSDIRSVARDSAAPKDGHNFQNLAPEVSLDASLKAPRFSE